MCVPADKLVQSWLKEASTEELAAAILTMDKNLLKLVNRNLSQSELDAVRMSLSRIDDNNRQRLTDSFYKKVLKALR